MKLKSSSKGYKLEDRDKKGFVLSKKLVLPSPKMKISYHAPNGKLFVELLDEADNRLSDTHALTGAYQIDKDIKWQDTSIDKVVGKEIFVRFVLEGDAQIFDVSFDGVSSLSENIASIGSSDNRFVLPPRNNYYMNQVPAFVKSYQNLKLFPNEDPKLKGIQSGYQLKSQDKSANLSTRKISLPGEDMKITCDPGEGTVKVSLYDEKNDLIASSRIISGDLKVRESIKWKDDLKLTKFVSRPVSLTIDLSADAKVYAIRFDDLFWD